MIREIDSGKWIRPTKFAHVVSDTRNVARAARWYETVVGMRPDFENDFVAFLTDDDEQSSIGPGHDGAGEARAAAGRDHIAYTLNDLGELLGTYEWLKAVEILPVWSISHGPTTSIYYEDPDGNRVEFQVDNFGTREQMSHFLKSGVYEANPIGVDFGPEVLEMGYRRGDSESELLLQHERLAQRAA